MPKSLSGVVLFDGPGAEFTVLNAIDWSNTCLVAITVCVQLHSHKQSIITIRDEHSCNV